MAKPSLSMGSDTVPEYWEREKETERETGREKEPEKETGMQTERKREREKGKNRERATGGHVCCVGVFLAGSGTGYRALLVCVVLMYLRPCLQDVLQEPECAVGVR